MNLIKSRKQTIESVMDEFIMNGALDNHSPGTRLSAEKFDIVVLLTKGDICIGSTKVQYCSLNPLYKSEHDSELHLSQASSGGVLFKDKFLDYNERMIFDGGRIAKAYLIEDGTSRLVFSDKMLLEKANQW